jgi:hypothetical protein
VRLRAHRLLEKKLKSTMSGELYPVPRKKFVLMASAVLINPSESWNVLGFDVLGPGTKSVKTTSKLNEKSSSFETTVPRLRHK